MAEARATVPDFAAEIEVEMDAAMALRRELSDTTAGPVPSFNDLIVKACALTLREQPRVNSSYRDGTLIAHDRVNVGVAVAGDDTLHVPVVTDADRKPVAEIAAESRALATRARSGDITPPELANGTFTVSNLGMLGVTAFSAVVNPPQAAILAVGALRRVPVVRGDALEIGHLMTLRMSCDHRVVYGADAARFLARVRERLEHPLQLLI
jgi:pyruvate dehydrogenase E2 component (dihydrolipoamide acetyltransferase)